MSLALFKPQAASFSLGPTCPMCTQDFDDRCRLPKVLNCGHSFCIDCLEKFITSSQVSHYGDGGISKNFVCTICKSSQCLPSNGAQGFTTNHQLIEAVKPNDKRIVKCIQCFTPGTETGFHVCRECTIKKFDFDIRSLLDKNTDHNVDNFAICSTCILEDHNEEGHTVSKFAPLRIEWQYQKNVLTVNLAKAAVDKKFSNVRTLILSFPIFVERVETEINEMDSLMRRSISSHHQEYILRKYEQEMNGVVKLLEDVEKRVEDLNSCLETKLTQLQGENQKTEAFCHKVLTPLRHVLKMQNEEEPVIEEVHTDEKEQKA